MPLSDGARALLDLLDPGGRPANAGRLRTELGLTDGDFEATCQELYEAGVAEPVGRGGRVRRVAAEAAGLSPEAQMMLAALPDDGSTVGNYALRSQLDLDDETYARAKRELRGADLLNVGVGYGGTVSRAQPVRGRAAPAGAIGHVVGRESDLYNPFVEWLRSSLEDQDLAFAHARVTATPRGYRRGGGKWSRPDATAVQVFRYEWLPDISVEISSYEIKRAVDADKLDSVYEAAAHGRWAHRASLVVEHHGEERDAVAPAVYEEVSRMQLGLYVMRRRDDGQFDVRELIQPPLTPMSQPEDVNDLLGYFLSEDRRIRDAYMRAIGR